MPARGLHDAPTLDDGRNLIICPLPYDGAFMEIFYRGFGVVQQVLRADAKMPKEIALPNSADRQVARQLVERRDYPVLDVVDVLDPLAQPELLITDEVDPELVVPQLKAGRSQRVETGGVARAHCSREAAHRRLSCSRFPFERVIFGSPGMIVGEITRTGVRVGV